MIEITLDQDRQVIPIWRTLENTTKTGELNLRSHEKQTPWPTPRHHDPIAKTKATWKKHPTILSAADFIGAAIFWNRPHEAIDAIEFLDHKSEITKPLRESIELAIPSYFNTPPPTTPPTISIKEKAEQHVKELRAKLHNEPKRPFSQLDLARAYTTLGHNKKARQHILVAQQLAPDDRFVLRSAARFWLHVEENDRAHNILTQSDRTRHDPWLMAAEIAVGNLLEIKPRFVKKARSLFSDNSFPIFHLSELASAVATIEWNHGHHSHSEKLFAKSLEEPTDNSVAQAVWMSSKENFINLTDDHWSRPNVFEAKARKLYQEKKWEDALEQFVLWQNDQPFADEPALSGSFLAATIYENFSQSNEIAQIGLTANPQNPGLLVNAAYALINLERYDEAEILLSRLPKTDSDPSFEVARIANLGLIHYRTQNPQQGHSLYLDARSLAQRSSASYPPLYALVTSFHALEEFRQKSPKHIQLMRSAVSLLREHDNPTCEILIKKLEGMLDNTAGYSQETLN